MSVEELKQTDSDSETPNATREKICKVCGDKALGYNFNALTCESCKAFFRRNALKNKNHEKFLSDFSDHCMTSLRKCAQGEFKCPFNKKCDINPITRRFCQLCRLIKCFEIGMRKEYIMSEDDKREKRKKIETNRAIKKRAADNGNDAPSNPKPIKLKKKENEEEMEDDEIKKTQPLQSVKINLLNMASASKKTYKKKQFNYDSNAEQLLPFPSPELPEPSPDTVSVTESRTCNMFSENKSQSESSQSRFVEIYRISKPSKERNMVDVFDKNCGDSNVIQIFLDSEFSDPSSVYTNSGVSNQNEDKVCNYKNNLQSSGEFIINQTNILELSKNKNILLESTKDGKKILVISKDSLVAVEEEDEKKLQMSEPNSKEKKDHQSVNDLANKKDSSSSPLLTSLINSNWSSDGSPSFSSKTTISNKSAQEVSRDSVFGLSNSIDSILSEAIKLEYETYTSINPRMNSRELNDAERAKLNELIVANKALLAPLEDDMMADDFGFNVNSEFKPSMLVDVLNLTAVAIRRLIKMSKKINAFKNMCQDDQIALLKGGCTEMMILRSAMTYDPDRDSWKIPQSKEKLMNIKLDVLKEAGGKVFEEHQRFLQTFDQKWRNDENIMLILSAIALFTPDRARVVHYDVIKLEQNSYYYLLRRYLESIYQGCEARLTFLKLIHKISELHKLNEDHVRVYLDVNPKEVEPLLIEIFDLKPH